MNSLAQLLNRAADEIVELSSVPAMQARLNTLLPVGLSAELYLCNRGTRAQEPVPAASGVALCLRNRALVVAPDTRRSPLFHDEEKKRLPKSMIFVPMFAQTSLVGVMQVSHSAKVHDWNNEEQAALQHLANQAATAMRLQETGQLLAGIAGELRSPLGSILEIAGALKTRRGASRDPELDRIEDEALRASEIVSRLLALGRSEPADARPVDIQALLTRLLNNADDEVPARFVSSRILVPGSQAQLEQVFLTLIVHARQASSPKVPISVASILLGSRVLIEVAFQSGGDSRWADPLEGLGLCRAIVRSHGGDVRFVRVGNLESRFEVELPVIETSQLPAGPVPAQVRAVQRRLTALLIEPEAKVQKHILDFLTGRGDRVVPVGSVEEAADLVRRLRFDLVFCSRADLFESVRRHIGAFVLLTNGHDPELAHGFSNGEGFVLVKPVDDKALLRICDMAAERANGPSPLG